MVSPALKEKVLHVLLKKLPLDSVVLNKYRPNSSLLILGKVVEKVAVLKLMSTLEEADYSYFSEISGWDLVMRQLGCTVGVLWQSQDGDGTFVSVLLDLSVAFVITGMMSF